MNWEALGAIADLVSAIVVVVSVLYLAAQIRQGTRQARLGSTQAINASNDSAFDPIYIPENSAIFAKGQAEYPNLTGHERMVFDMLMARLTGSLAASTYQHDQGAYDRELYLGALRYFSRFFSSPGGLAWFRANGSAFTASLTRNLEAAIQAEHSRGAS
jgi:hypothetical protein